MNLMNLQLQNERVNMKRDIKVVFFDLFFTLVIPKYSDLRNENDDSLKTNYGGAL